MWDVAKNYPFHPAFKASMILVYIIYWVPRDWGSEFSYISVMPSHSAADRSNSNIGSTPSSRGLMVAKSKRGSISTWQLKYLRLVTVISIFPWAALLVLPTWSRLVVVEPNLAPGPKSKRFCNCVVLISPEIRCLIVHLRHQFFGLRFKWTLVVAEPVRGEDIKVANSVNT